MNQGILAARTATALADIERETRRLGGELTIAPGRGDAVHRQLHTLEAIASALGGIGVTDEDAGQAGVEDATPTEDAAKPSGKRDGKGKA